MNEDMQHQKIRLADFKKVIERAWREYADDSGHDATVTERERTRINAMAHVKLFCNCDSQAHVNAVMRLLDEPAASVCEAWCEAERRKRKTLVSTYLFENYSARDEAEMFLIAAPALRGAAERVREMTQAPQVKACPLPPDKSPGAGKGAKR